MKTIINPKYEYLREFIETLPSKFDVLGETLFDSRNCIKTIQIEGVKLNIKSFKVPNIINKFVYGNLRQSKAFRSFQYANNLILNGINTPEPVAYIEEKVLLSFGRSYYISVHEEFDGMMREFKWGQLEGREELLKQFAQFTAEMHRKNILHLDYSPGNILYKKQSDKYSFYVVDLNRMSFEPIGIEKGCFNFRRLWGNQEMLTYIAKEYAKARNFDEAKCIRLILKYHKEFWISFTKKHKEKSPYEG